jgi:hypothetical protein
MAINPDQTTCCIAWQAMKRVTASGTLNRMLHLIFAAFPAFVDFRRLSSQVPFTELEPAGIRATPRELLQS